MLPGRLSVVPPGLGPHISTSLGAGAMPRSEVVTAEGQFQGPRFDFVTLLLFRSKTQPSTPRFDTFTLTQLPNTLSTNLFATSHILLHQSLIHLTLFHSHLKYHSVTTLWSSAFRIGLLPVFDHLKIAELEHAISLPRHPEITFAHPPPTFPKHSLKSGDFSISHGFQTEGPL